MKQKKVFEKLSWKNIFTLIENLAYENPLMKRKENKDNISIYLESEGGKTTQSFFALN